MNKDLGHNPTDFQSYWWVCLCQKSLGVSWHPEISPSSCSYAYALHPHFWNGSISEPREVREGSEFNITVLPSLHMSNMSFPWRARETPRVLQRGYAAPLTPSTLLTSNIPLWPGTCALLGCLASDPGVRERGQRDPGPWQMSKDNLSELFDDESFWFMWHSGGEYFGIHSEWQDAKGNKAPVPLKAAYKKGLQMVRKKFKLLKFSLLHSYGSTWDLSFEFGDEYCSL